MGAGQVDAVRAIKIIDQVAKPVLGVEHGVGHIGGVLLEQRQCPARVQAARQVPVKQFGSGSMMFGAETAFGGHGGFQQQLGREAGLDVLLGWGRAGLVVQDGKGAVGIALDSVGAAGQAERTAGPLQFDGAASFRGDGDRGAVCPAFSLGLGDPFGDAVQPG